MQELGAFYNARLTGEPAELDPVLPFHRYAENRAASAIDEAAERYWLGEYKDLPPPLELPTDRPRPSVKTFRGATFTAQLDAPLIDAVRKAGKAHGATLFATLFAATQVMLGKLGGEQDIALTVPMAGQTLVEDEVLFGHCVNFLPVRARFEADAPFSRYLEAVKSKIFSAIDHQQYTYGTLVHRLALKRDPNRTPITDVQFNHEKFGAGLDYTGLSAFAASNPKAFVNFDLFFNMTESDKGVRVDVDYSTDLYDEATIARWLGHLATLLAAIAKDTAKPIAALPMLDERQTQWLIDDLNATAREYPNALVHELVEAQAKRTPDAVAYECEGERLTYRTLIDRVDDLAARLAACVPGDRRIAVALPRSIELPVALLAVLKSGNAYVPLDPTHPSARLTQTLQAARVSAMICAEDSVAALADPAVHVLRADLQYPEAKAAIAAPAVGAAAPAYVIFTSGSTGTPKGVEVSHRSVVNFLTSMAVEPGFHASDTIVAVTTVSFDIAGLELFLPLITGGRAVIVSREQVRDGFALAGAINAAGATVLQATPSLWRMLVEAGLKLGPHLKMLCGGEPLPRDLANTLLASGGELWNVYGPTETTIWSSAGRIERGDGAITIGAPIANTQIHILDASDRLAPIGAVGDVYIGGDGLARGYFDRDDLTKTAFRTLELNGKSQRLYRTGDVGRRLANGAIQLQGRKDQQVKLRGYRIELEDIETHLRRAPGVTDAAVALQNARDADARLVGYYVAADGNDIPNAALVRHLAEKLPEYMVPSLWQRLDAMPQTANGKLNRKALPVVRPVRELKTVAQSDAPQLTALESKISEVWKDLLQLEDVGIDTHFFEAGGHSVLAMQMVVRVQNALGRKTTMADLFRCPRLRDFANRIGAADADADTARIVPIQPLGTEAPLIVLNNNWDLYPLSKAIGANRPLISIQFVDRSITEPKPDQSFDAIVDEAVRLIRRARPRGPYVLAGHCVLGAVAFEAARRLKSEGEAVELVALLDSEPNRRFKGISVPQKLKNALVHHVRDARWLLGLLAERKVNLLYVAARYRMLRRLGVIGLAKAFGFKERWNDEDFHTQHVVDAWTYHRTAPYDGDVVIYRALPHERLGFLDRWAPWVPIWGSIVGERLRVRELKVPHAEIFREPAASEIGTHMTELLREIDGEGKTQEPVRKRAA